MSLRGDLAHRLRQNVPFQPGASTPRAELPALRASSRTVDLAGPGTIEIEFATGARMRIAGAAGAATLTAAVADLAESRADCP
jgi:hypothetical protein